MCMQDQCMCVHEILMSTMRNIIINTLWCWSCCGCPVAMYSQSSAVPYCCAQPAGIVKGLLEAFAQPCCQLQPSLPPFQGADTFSSLPVEFSHACVFVYFRQLHCCACCRVPAQARFEQLSPIWRVLRGYPPGGMSDPSSKAASSLDGCLTTATSAVAP